MIESCMVADQVAAVAGLAGLTAFAAGWFIRTASARPSDECASLEADISDLIAVVSERNSYIADLEMKLDYYRQQENAAHEQRVAAARRGGAAKAAKIKAQRVVAAEATLKAAKEAPPRPRDEVVADVRDKRAARKNPARA